MWCNLWKQPVAAGIMLKFGLMNRHVVKISFLIMTVILISGSINKDVVHEADDFFVKPLDLEPLVKRIKELTKL